MWRQAVLLPIELSKRSSALKTRSRRLQLSRSLDLIGNSGPRDSFAAGTSVRRTDRIAGAE
jgi:hypothetical protein